jgi:hypothetical protein
VLSGSVLSASVVSDAAEVCVGAAEVSGAGLFPHALNSTAAAARTAAAGIMIFFKFGFSSVPAAG